MLKLQYFGYLMWRVDSWKDPDAGKYWRQGGKGVTEDEMVGCHHQLNGHEFEQTREILKNREVWCAAVHGITKNQTWLNDWTTTKMENTKDNYAIKQAFLFFYNFICSFIYLQLCCAGSSFSWGVFYTWVESGLLSSYSGPTSHWSVFLLQIMGSKTQELH